MHCSHVADVPGLPVGGTNGAGDRRCEGQGVVHESSQVEEALNASQTRRALGSQNQFETGAEMVCFVFWTDHPGAGGSGGGWSGRGKREGRGPGRLLQVWGGAMSGPGQRGGGGGRKIIHRLMGGGGGSLA